MLCGCLEILIKRSKPFPRAAPLLIDSDSRDSSPGLKSGSLIKMHYYEDVRMMQIVCPPLPSPEPPRPPPVLLFLSPRRLIKLINCAKKRGRDGDVNNEIGASQEGR